MKRKAFLCLYLVFFVVSCTPQVEPSNGAAPRVGKIVPVGEPVRVDLHPTTEKIPNCSGSTSTVSKHADMTIVTGHSVEWEVGGEAGVGVTIGEGVLPFGVDLSSALTGSTGEGIVQEFSQSSSWTLSASPGEIVEYTLAWWELWQSGYIDVTLADRTVHKVIVRYRSGIHSEITAQIAYDCNGQVKTVLPIPTTTLAQDNQNVTIESLLAIPTVQPVASPSLSTTSTTTENRLFVTVLGEVCKYHNTGYCGLETQVTWSDIDSRNGRIYVIGYNPYYGPNNQPLWWIAGTGVTPEISTGMAIITDGAFGKPGDPVSIFACQMQGEYLFSESITKHEFSERPNCIFSSEPITLNTK